MIYRVELHGNNKVTVNDCYDMSLDEFIQACKDRNKEKTITLSTNDIP